MLNLFLPKKTNKSSNGTRAAHAEVAAVIPTYKPTKTTVELVASLLKWYPKLQVVVVDDSTPLTTENSKTINAIKALAKKNKKLTYLRTPVNALKAGALNFGISYLQARKNRPDVIFTSDDDVEVNEQTFTIMVEQLLADRKIGAVCSLALVKNKNKNILTRLQSLEYHSYNLTRTADNGFLKGPMVMHGMLTAFKSSVLKQINGFTQNHLIEDYDITVRMKNAGYDSKLALNAKAWTEVPETLEDLWKQRVRWSYGGLGVVSQYYRNVSAIFQDLMGHTLFITLSILVLLSIIVERSYLVSSTIIIAVVSIAIINFIAAFTINLATMLLYPRRDKFDWALKTTVIPELIYCNILTMILVGSYLFFAYNRALNPLVKRVNIFFKPYNAGLNMFSKIGYSSTWGTR